MSTTPIPVRGGIKFYQTTLREILDMGENMYWSMLKIWDLNRDELLQEENEETKILSDFDV